MTFSPPNKHLHKKVTGTFIKGVHEMLQWKSEPSNLSKSNSNIQEMVFHGMIHVVNTYLIATCLAKKKVFHGRRKKEVAFFFLLTHKNSAALNHETVMSVEKLIFFYSWSA